MPTVQVRLPTELWREVILHATYVPDLLKIVWDYDPDDQLWHGWQFIEDLEIDTKLAIVQVCREWRALGTEFLYEAIQIPPYDRDGGKSPELDALLATLRASSPTLDLQGSPPSSTSSAPDSGYGWWIKHIDLPSEILLPENFVQLTSLLHQCHNLSILIIRGDEAEHDILSRLLSILESRFSHSLRRLDLKIHDPGHRIFVLPNIPLASLDVNLDLSSDISALDSSGNMSLATVSSLTLDLPFIFRHYPESLHFPNLRHLGLMNVRDDDISAVNHFVERHNSTLVSVYFQSRSVCEELPSILLAGINLRTLTFDDVDLVNLQYEGGEVVEGRSFQTITHLGILSFNPTTYLERSMEGVKLINPTDGNGMFPNLTVLRLMHQVGPVPATNEWVEVIARCAGNGVRLQDREGKALRCQESSFEI